MVGAMSQADSSEIDEYVRRAVADAPPLTPEQRSKLRTLLDTGETVLRPATASDID
ncbi:hypothetical protein MHAS44199_01345 [Mycolicibacterium hassiacum DSM 44199]|nr:hypothetical protein [Mycolicibacterium hassiacum DSM 44199]